MLKAITSNTSGFILTTKEVEVSPVFTLPFQCTTLAADNSVPWYCPGCCPKRGTSPVWQIWENTALLWGRVIYKVSQNRQTLVQLD